MHFLISSIAVVLALSTSWAKAEICRVPEVPNGKIGRYIPRNNQNTLDFSKIPVGTELKDNEKLFLICEEKYKPMGQANWQARVSCSQGKWSNKPHCTTAGCLELPPPVDHAKAEVLSTADGLTANYVCEAPYILAQNTTVQCTSGEWRGQPPKCRDSRCYSKNLLKLTGVSLEMDSVTNSGEYLKVQCKEGYTLKKRKPLCLNGVWTENSTSPCRKRKCSVDRIPNGVIQEKIPGKMTSDNKFSPTLERPFTFENVAIGKTPSRSAVLFLTCNEGYFLQGTKLNRARIRCENGKWSPDTVCVPKKFRGDFP